MKLPARAGFDRSFIKPRLADVEQIRIGGAKSEASHCGNTSSQMTIVHVYEVQPRSDKCGVDLISDALPFGRLWYGTPNAVSNAVGYAKFFSRSHDAEIRVFDKAGNVIETHENAGDFKEW